MSYPQQQPRLVSNDASLLVHMQSFWCTFCVDYAVMHHSVLMDAVSFSAEVVDSGTMIKIS